MTELAAGFSDNIKNALAVLPEKPGVYLMHDASGKVIYVGKAVVLKNRVRSYFRNLASHTPKVKAMVAKIAEIETIVTSSEVEALILECNLIKKYRPRYNISLKDDKTYPYLKVTMQEDFPRLYVTRRQLRDGARYYGPYADAGAMHATVKLLRSMFPLRTCRKMNPDRPCLNYHIKRCLAPCAGYISKADYHKMIKSICMVLDGRTTELERDLKQQMQEAARRQVEQAAAANALAEKNFMAENAKRPGVTVTASGLQYEVLRQGSGAKPAASSVVRVHYTGTLLDGTKFDSSVDRGEPAEFGVNQVIAGWTEALQLMPVGSKYKLYIPAAIAYGARGAGEAIPPNAALIFEVELLDIVG